MVQDDYPAMKDAAGLSLDMTSVADIMDGRLVHALFSLALDQRSMDMEGFEYFLTLFWDSTNYFSF